MPKKPSSLSFSIKDKRLLIGRNGVCNYRIRIWPHPKAEVREGNYWERFYLEFRLISYPLPKPKKKKDTSQLELGLDLSGNVANTKPTKKQAYEQLRQTLPSSYALALAPFKSHQWNMVVFLSFHRRFYELIKSNPALAFLLANRREFNWRVYRKEINLEDLTGMKQPALLELLNLPGTKRLVQITKKIHPASITLGLVEYLNYYGRNEEISKMLSHLKKVNSGVMAMLANHDIAGSHITPQLLEEVGRSRSNNHYPIASHQLMESLRWHCELHPGQAAPVFRTLEALNHFHEEMIASAARLVEEARPQARELPRAERLEMVKMMNRKPFPAPPIAGTDDIIPLRTALELSIEGNRQHNCVGDYANLVHSGKCYIYRILKPQRATLSIVKTASGEWAIGELFTACNNHVDEKTEQAVSDWLSNAQLGI